MKKKNIIIIAVVTACILMIPLVAMQFTEEVNWSLSDFIIMGTLIFGTGVVYDWISSRGNNKLYRIAVSIAVFTVFLLTWVNMAVGIIGSDKNDANLMYFSLIPIGLAGALIVKFQANGMAVVAFVLAGIQMLIPITAFIINKPDFDPGVAAVFAINAIFSVLFIGSGLLFKRSALTKVQPQ